MKKRLTLAVAIAIIAVAGLIIFRCAYKKLDYEGYVVSVNLLSPGEEEDAVALKIDGTEFGYESCVYIMITSQTKVINSEGKSFPADSLMAGDKVKVYYAEKAIGQNIIKAKRVEYEFNINK